MNKIFSLGRFRRLFFKHTSEHYKGYLMSLGVLNGVMLLGGSFLVLLIGVNLDKNAQTVFFMFLLLLAGTLFTSTVFADLGDKKKAVSQLTLPASHLEKYLVVWVYSFLAFMVFYTLSFCFAVLFTKNIKHFPNLSEGLFNVFQKRVFQLYLVYAFLHAIAIWGAVYFEKLHFIKTALVCFISLAVLVFINKVVLGAMIGRGVEATPPFGNLLFSDNGQMTDINIPGQQQDPYLMYVLPALALIFWVAAYYRLKEKQV